MDGEPPKRLETFKIVCTLYPEIFDIDKSICKNYFRQYGKVLRLIFKPKQRAIVVEYTNKNDYLNALAGSSEYEGQPFKMEAFESLARPPPPNDLPKKKSREKVVKRHKLAYISPKVTVRKPDVSYVDTEEVNDELAAMGAYSSVQALEIYDLTSDSSHLQALPPPPPPPRVPKLNRVWKKSTQIVPESSVAKQKKSVVVKKKLVQTLAKRRLKEKSQMLTTEQLELLKVIKTQANTVEEKCRILDARDKLLRSINKKPRLKSNPTVGTCPDMCPEKERLRRELQHQISIFEQDDTSRHFMNHSKAVKQYSRSSADQEAPLPHELRPVHVLQFTMTYLMFNIMDLSETDQEVNIGEWFHFLWDRTRGIRKDITQQALCCHGSVELVEQCARFHIHCSARLMGEDPSVFDQKINTENLTKCLQTLKYMYHDLKLKGEECPNEPEFRAYIILLNLSDGNFMWEVQELSRDIQKSREVKFALQIYSAFEKRNYVRFFKLIKSTTYLNACILMRYFLQVRVQAIESLIKCFTPIKSISFYPTKELTNLLFFDYEEATVDFMKTYGLGLNKDGTHLMIERISFSIPEYPYVMERSHCVERKRTLSVGATVNGHELSPEMYMEIQSHVVHDSFDKDGCLVQDEMFNEIERTIEERLLDEPDSSRESTPERKSMVTNIFAAAKHPSQSTSKHTSSPSKAPKEDKNIFSQPNEDVFGQSKHESGNIFVLKSSNFFGQSRTDEGNIFGQIQTDQVKPTGNIFAMTCEKGIDQVDNIKQKENIFIDFGNKEIRDVPNIFSRKPTGSEKVDGFEPIEVKEDNTFPTEHKTPTISANRDPRTQKSFVFGPSAPPTTEAEQNIFASVKPVESKKGGFFFVLNRPSKPIEVPNIFATGFSQSAEMEEEKLRDEAELEALEKERHKLQEEIKKEIAREEDEEMRKQEEVRQRIEEMRRRNEEAAERRRLEAERTRMEEIKRKRLIEEERLEKERRLEEERIDRLKLLEEERLRQENERIKLEKERKRRDEELEREKREENERRTLLEIERTVKLVIADLIENVDTTLRQANLKRIRSTIQRRALMKICKKWRNFTVTRMRKRKALDCNPVFVYTKSITQCAKDLQSKSQDSTLLYMKRYKYGKPLDVPLSEEPSMMKLNLFHLTYSSLRRRLCELKEKWHQHIYWKVVFSIPDIDEMLNGLHTLEETLKSYIGWELDKYGNTVYIEQHKTVTYCMEKQQGFDVTNNDANAFVFIAKSFNDVMQQRIFQNLKDFGVYVKLPVVLILEDTTNADEYLNNLLETGIVSDYVIYSCGLNSVVLPSIIDNALIFSSKHVEKYPPLELDTLYSFLMKNLCTEMWKKASSYARWNHEYNFCMRDPNIVINLYNEGLDILTKIAISDKCKEHSTFPAIFLNYLPDKIPDALPCDYRYFPQFWATSNYQRNLRETMDALHLPKFMEKWPPENDNDLIVSVSKYCTEVFKYPKEPLIAVLNTFRDYAEDLDFDRIIWTEAVQVLAEEKLKESDLKLPKIFNSDVYNTLVVVYDRFDLQEYNSLEWFYRNNPTIEGFKKVVSEKVEEEKHEIKLQTQQKRKRALEYSMDGDDVLEVIDKAEKILKSSNSVCLNTKDRIDHLNRSLRDLEDSINVVKRMDQMNLLRRFIDN